MKTELKDMDLEVVSSGKSQLAQQTTQQQGVRRPGMGVIGILGS